MKYFLTQEQRRERHSTCFHEFFPGKWDEKTFWSESSLCLDDDLMARTLGRAVAQVVPEYDRCGVTEITGAQWHAIGQAVRTENRRTRAIYKEADEWLRPILAEHGCFTILGI